MEIEKLDKEVTELLAGVRNIILDRHSRHGDSAYIHDTISSMMTTITKRKFSTEHVFMHNLLTKLARLMYGNGQKEHIVDVIGYAVLWHIHEQNKSANKK